ncbi:hypothetical protein IE81DRAFT_351208 [Ceraceosorus guamensis]|uniref:Uncharacterized protein n=1 Tax=Ceraceosorus guamensis TaxID=1522189 RepID=A0A316WH36_9BASI|nr:hypothetical protein IE81DRAFT_351208 [Ceraceosorus guamensis]PWN46395.1 hypothetical protein IE81DRAFT_351208 [Ceraceosorus guamensis]
MSRAQLLAGLRTGGPRSSSPSAVEDGMFQAQQSTSPVSTQDGSKAGSPNTLKANAAVFTPGQRVNSPQREQTPPQNNGAEGQQQLLEAHFAALRVQQAMALQNQNSLAALYGAAQGQPQQHYNAQQQAYEALVRQHQQQEEIRRQQQAAIAQLEQLRSQAANSPQQQQRLLLAQIHAEYERQAQLAALAEQVQAQQLQSSAAEQRQAAQATIQANLRNRQTQQAYTQLLEQQQRNQQQDQDQAQAEAELMQRLQYIQMHYAAQQQQQAALGLGQTASPPMRAAQQLNRAGSPSDKNGARPRQPSHADAASSWRQRATGASNASNPSIVVDDSASEISANGSASDVHTPDTSDEDVRDGATLDKVQAAAAAMTARYGAVVDKQSKSVPSVPRAISLTAAPRSRNFTAEAKSVAMSNSGSGSNGGLAAPTQPARQPRGPPTDFQPVNFASRISARTRKEAMSRLCASPRAASFSQRVVSVA